jgi:hypothetical protein
VTPVLVKPYISVSINPENIIFWQFANGGHTRKSIMAAPMFLRIKRSISKYVSESKIILLTCTARTARFSKKSLGSDIGEIKKMSEKLKKKSVFTPRNVREKSNTVIYYKTPTLTIRRREIKEWDINLYLYICMFLRLSFLIIWMIHSKYLFSFSGVQAMWSFFIL